MNLAPQWLKYFYDPINTTYTATTRRLTKCEFQDI